MDIQLQKSIIIEQFNQINDINLINAIKSMLDYALNKEEEYFDMERFKRVRGNPESLLNWDEAKKTLTA